LIGTRVGVPDGLREPAGVLDAVGVVVAGRETGVVDAAVVAAGGALGGVDCAANDGRITGAVCLGAGVGACGIGDGLGGVG
jgi:hypothetical protein